MTYVSEEEGLGGSCSSEGARAWHQLPLAQLERIILQQLPRFRSRLYIADAGMLAILVAREVLERMPGDYSWSLCFEPAFIIALVREGFLPICCELGGGATPGLCAYVLLPKLHEQRCVLELGAMHVSRKVRKHAGRYTLTVCQAFFAVIEACIAQHGTSWLYPPMMRLFASLSVPPSLDGLQGSAPRFVSFELWSRPPAGSAEPPALVAGDLGCVVGRSYTSYSGFHAQSGAGSVQLALTAALLERAGFGWWDLGQEHGYKTVIGATVLPRAVFLRRFRQLRVQPNRLAELLGAGGDATEAATLAATAHVEVPARHVEQLPAMAPGPGL